MSTNTERTQASCDFKALGPLFELSRIQAAFRKHSRGTSMGYTDDAHNRRDREYPKFVAVGGW